MRQLLRPLLAVAAVALALVLQVSVLPHLALRAAEPDLVLLVVLALASVWGTGLGAFTGFCAGLAVDLAPPSVTAAGRHALLLTLVGALAGRAAAEARRSALRTSLLAGLCAGAATLGNALLGSLLGEGGTLTSPGLRRRRRRLRALHRRGDPVRAALAGRPRAADRGPPHPAARPGRQRDRREPHRPDRDPVTTGTGGKRREPHCGRRTAIQ